MDSIIFLQTRTQTENSYLVNTFDLNGVGSKCKIIKEKHEASPHDSLTNELLYYHKRFGHINYDRLYEMARQGIIPKRLAKAPKLACTSCLYAKATRRGWRNKSKKKWVN